MTTPTQQILQPVPSGYEWRPCLSREGCWDSEGYRFTVMTTRRGRIVLVDWEAGGTDQHISEHPTVEAAMLAAERM